ncbi:Ctr copper transporter [Aspergillus heteromorphus CBS 117.55]|uniref:Copper transport protein n=1 Tax=Aspergillus heteromorphus CBS 117.55 TaxID=1448321 RepID=A0A317X0Q6_9EURO|nr:Ctr copper transporter [Aspergillus heteromorphus CBS 117.55]PWY91172.1 Ctr copper transporter [Aspergillus heteromorphus CBS 117.55]
MFWNWNTIDTCFISKTWHITSVGMFAGSCIAVVGLVILLEFLRRAAREYDVFIHHRALAIAKPAPEQSTRYVHRPSILEQLIRAVLYTAQFAVAYFIVLLAITFNGYIIICVFVGAFLGAFVFSWEMVGGSAGGSGGGSAG